jgi:hypothetical protein
LGVVASRWFSDNVATFDPYDLHFFFPEGGAFTLGQGAVVLFVLVDEPTSGLDPRRRIELLTATHSRMEQHENPNDGLSPPEIVKGSWKRGG